MNDLDAFFYKDTPHSEEKGVLVFISNMDFSGMDQLWETVHKRQQ